MKLKSRKYTAYLFFVFFAYRAFAAETAPQDFDAKIAPFRESMRIFSDGNGHYISIADSFAKNGKEDQPYLANRFFWGNGETFDQLKQEGFAGNDLEFQMDFSDPRIESDGTRELALRNDKITVNCKGKEATYVQVAPDAAAKVKGAAQFKPLPDQRKLEYIALDRAKSEIIYVDASKNDYSYTSFRFFKGPQGQLKEYKIKSVQRYRDGGTTIIDSDAGSFYSPTPLRRTESMKFTPKESGKATTVDDLIKNGPVPELEKKIGAAMNNQLKTLPLATPCNPFFQAD